MKIAIYHNLRSGGAKRALFNYTKGLVENGHTVDVFAAQTADEDFLDVRPLVRGYHEVPLWVSPGSTFGRTRVGAALALYATSLALARHGRAAAKAIDAGDYDVAFVAQCQFANSPDVLRFLTTPSAYYCQEPRRVSFEYSVRYHTAQVSRLIRFVHALYLALLDPWLRRRDIRAARSATLILANSYYSVESIKRAYGRYARVAYLGTDLGALPAAKVARRRNAVISVGALEPAKCHELVVDAVGTVPEGRRPEMHVVADRAFDGRARALADRAAALGVALSIHERISDVELVELYSGARAAVCAAELEPFGFTPLEAMACATPVVAVREGGYKETVVDGVNGRLVERDVQALGLAIDELLADEVDWRKLSSGALDSVSRWSVQAATATLERLLAELAAP